MIGTVKRKSFKKISIDLIFSFEIEILTFSFRPKAEGKYFDFEGEDQINTDFLETFSFDSPDQYIMTETDEFSALNSSVSVIMY